MGGVPEDRIVCVKEERDAKYELHFDCERIYLLHELYSNQIAAEERIKIINMIEEKTLSKKVCLGV